MPPSSPLSSRFSSSTLASFDDPPFASAEGHVAIPISSSMADEPAGEKAQSTWAEAEEEEVNEANASVVIPRLPSYTTSGSASSSASSTKTLAAGAGAAEEEKATYPPSTTEYERTVRFAGEGEEGGREGLPDGGKRAWMNVAGGWLILFSSFGFVNAWGAFQAYYQMYRFPTSSSSAISWIGSVQLCLFFLMALVAGPVFDKGYFRALIAVGSALWITSIFLIPVATSYSQAMAIQGILGGIGVGLLFLPALSMQSHWFERRRNLAIGIVASGSSLGGIAFPIMLNKLFSNPDVGFAKGVRSAGFVILTCLLLANLLTSPNPTRARTAKPPLPPLRSLFTLPYTLLVLSAMVMNFGLWFPNFYIELYGAYQGLNLELCQYLLAVFNAGSFFGRTIPNALADRLGPLLISSLCCLGAGLTLFFMHFAKDAPGVIVFAAVYGFLSGGFISLVSPVVVSLSKDLSEIGLRQGIAFLIVAGAAVGGNPIAGQLLANNDNDFLHPIIFAGTMTLAGGALTAGALAAQMREKKTWRRRRPPLLDVSSEPSSRLSGATFSSDSTAYDPLPFRPTHKGAAAYELPQGAPEDGVRTQKKVKQSDGAVPVIEHSDTDHNSSDSADESDALGQKNLVSYPSYPPSASDPEKSCSAETVGTTTVIPDGGLRAWLNVAGGWLILFSSFGFVNAWGAFQAYYQLYRFPNQSSSAISWIGSVQLCHFFVLTLVAGPVFDKGHFRILIAVGSALWVTSVILVPEAKTYGQAMAVQGLMGGIGVGLLFLPALSMQSHWFERRRNLAVGIVASGSSLGGIAFPIMLNKLFSNPDVGFAEGVRSAGYVILACLVVANAIMSPNPARHNIEKSPMPPVKSLFSSPYTLMCLGAMVLNFGLWFPNFYIELYGNLNGLNLNLCSYLLAIFNTGSFFGRTIPNALADRFGPLLVQTLCVFSAAIVLFFMKLATSSTGVVLFAFIYGFTSGGFVSLVSPTIVSMSGDLSEIGLRSGIACLIVAGAAVGGNPIAGKLLADNDNSFTRPIIFSVSSLFISVHPH
ncbi:hypothetical protein JCM8097_001296 [Rhodosporidiobolus ruineniae]